MVKQRGTAGVGLLRPSPPGLLLAVFGAVLLMAWGARLVVLSMLSESVLGCRLCVLPNVLAADALYMAGMLAAFVLSLTWHTRAWRFIIRGIALAALWLYLLDVAVMAQFNTRLLLADIRVYTADVSLASGLLLDLPAWQLALLGSGLALTVWLWWVPVSKSWRPTSALLAVAMLAGVGWLMPWLLSPAPYVHQWAVRNVVGANWPTGMATPYADSTRRRLQQTQPPVQCWPGTDRQQHVLMLVLESWSTYHSDRWLGVNDWTPQLDALAGQGLWFSRFYAGGHNTNEGLVSLLAGKEITLPVRPAREATAFAGAWQLDTSLPVQLEGEGYHSVFLTSGDLSYTRKGEWLRAIGFDEVQGNEAAAFDGLERQHFGSVADATLYDHAWRKISAQRQQGTPTFTVVENVSSHQPYRQPETGEQSEEAVFRYMDRTAAAFIRRLLAADFLEDGMIMVVSDHRAMTFMTQAEQDRFGTEAAARIPGFVLAKGVSGEKYREEYRNAVHQADIMPTVMERMGKRVYSRRGMRALLHDSRQDRLTPRCLLHARGDQRDRVDVFCPNGYGQVEVNGDASHFVRSSALSAKTERRVRDAIARERLQLVP